MVKVWALADLHLAVDNPSKSMDPFGPAWHNHTERTAEAWRDSVREEDLVLIPGDISWAMRIAEAMPDLLWIHALPGTKVMIRGNHDYWWSSLNKVRNALPDSIFVIQNDSFNWRDLTIGGARLWDTPEFNFDDYVVMRENPLENSKVKETEAPELQARQFEKELRRLELSLEQLDLAAKTRVVMTHYPPIGANLAPSKASSLLERYNVELCVFGHIHNAPPNSLPFGTARGVRYALTACDYLDCQPLLLYDLG